MRSSTAQWLAKSYDLSEVIADIPLGRRNSLGLLSLRSGTAVSRSTAEKNREKNQLRNEKMLTPPLLYRYAEYGFEANHDSECDRVSDWL